MNKVELNKMAVDIALGNLQNKLHHIIDGIASAKAFDQYNAKCGEIERLRGLVEAAYYEGLEDGVSWCEDNEQRWWQSNTYAALQPKEGE